MELLGLFVIVEGKCHYAHHEEDVVNEHLLTGLMSALTSFYYEIFDGTLRHIQLNDICFKMQSVSNFGVMMMYRGDHSEAEQYLSRVLEEIVLNRVVDFEIDSISREQEQILEQIITEITVETATATS